MKTEENANTSLRERLFNAKPNDLDGLVVDVVLKEASAINNEGVGKQMLFLLSNGLSVEDIEQYLKAKGVEV